jgi:hypothetical protein
MGANPVANSSQSRIPSRLNKAFWEIGQHFLSLSASQATALYACRIV